MQNPTFPEDVKSIPDLTFEAVKNQNHSDRFLRKKPLDTITYFPYRCNPGRVSPHKAGNNFIGEKQTQKDSAKENHPSSRLYDFLGVDYVAI